MKTYKVVDGCGKRFIVRAYTYKEAKQEALSMTSAYQVYLTECND